MKIAILLPNLFVATMACAGVPAPPPYTAYDLGYGQARAINSFGTIVGFSGTFAAHHAFSYSDGVMTDLGTLGGANSAAASINNAGIIAGTSDSGSGYWHGFSYGGGRMTDLGVFTSYYSYANGINDSGTIAGSVWTSGNKDHAAFYSGGQWTDLGTLGGNYSAAAAINSRGAIVGWSDLRYGTHAFLYQAGVMTDLGTFGGSVSYGLDINDNGVVVGYGTTPGDQYYQAFCYRDGVMTGIGTLGGAYSSANAINSSGTIVGNADFNLNGDHHAFRYSDGVMTDLAPYLLPIGLTGSSEALDVNDRGDIVGSGYDAQGQLHAFLLVVPEPSSVALWMVGAAMLALRRRGG